MPREWESRLPWSDEKVMVKGFHWLLISEDLIQHTRSPVIMSVQCWCECAGAAINQPVSCSIIWDHCANSGDWTLGFSNCDNDIPKRSRGLLLVLWKNSYMGSCISTWNWDACLLQRSSWIGWAVLRIFNINGKSMKVFRTTRWFQQWEGSSEYCKCDYIDVKIDKAHWTQH